MQDKTRIEAEKIIKNTPLSKKDRERIEKGYFDQYLIYNNKEETAYCTSCKEISKGRKYGHNEVGECPLCKTRVVFKTKGKFTLSELKYIITYHRKTEDKIVIMTRAMTRRYSKASWEVISKHGTKVETMEEPVHIYVFLKGKKTLVYKNEFYWNYWVKSDKVTANGIYCGFVPVCSDNETFHKAISKSYLRYCEEGILQQGEYYQLKAIELFHGNLHLEKLVKVGLSHFIENKLIGRTMGATTNFQKDTLLGILRLKNRKELKMFLRTTRKWQNLKLIQQARKENWNIKEEELEEMGKIIKESDFSCCRKINQPLKKYIKYKQKQTTISGRSLWEFNNYYQDYIRLLEMLEYDLAKPANLYPKNLRIAHDRVAKEFQILSDKKEAEKQKKRNETFLAIAKKNQKYSYGNEKIEIRIIKDLDELLKEGREQGHCVASYDKRHEQGKTEIWVVRKKENPEKPFYTLEWEPKKKEVLQVRGESNRNPTPEVEAFVKEWKEWRSKKEKKTKKKQSEKMQEAAIAVGG